MPEPNLSREAKEFIFKMQPKHARQVLMKLLDLCADRFPPDAKTVKGTHEDYFRADVGEYRVIYRVAGSSLLVPIIGKRNDDEVYKEMKRRNL